ncbi:MAG: aminotransferase class I/II-fold pyridoxal phosphate-dependent enzyme, partial [Candidatus Omnitrophica bacterium]|nr:aminotransferase class I/II-fold pyridoxal phosphate-dependent enzyme [Candidatus Omnitrophota bacterium]
MKERIADRVNKIEPSGIREFFDLVLGMKDIISLGIGEPDFVTPWHIREAGIYALEEGYTSYTSNQGLPQLRKIISQYIHRRFGVKYDPDDEVLITVGVSEAYDLAIRAVVNPGDEVLVPQPCYVCYYPVSVLAE